MIRKPVTIQLDNGLEARPIALLVQEASQYASQIYIEIKEKRINAKSIMGMMSLNVTEGEDEEKAAQGIELFLNNVK